MNWDGAAVVQLSWRSVIVSMKVKPVSKTNVSFNRCSCSVCSEIAHIKIVSVSEGNTKHIIPDSGQILPCLFGFTWGWWGDGFRHQRFVRDWAEKHGAITKSLCYIRSKSLSAEQTHETLTTTKKHTLETVLNTV